MNATYLLSLLPFLACPLGMGLMMWLMMRGKKDQTTNATRVSAGQAPAGQPIAGHVDADDRLASLRAQLGEVEAQQTAIAARLDRLGTEGQSVEPAGSASTGPREQARPAR